MKTHDLAKQLTLMAKILRSSPNIEMEDWEPSKNLLNKSTNITVKEEEIPHALNILVGLNQVNKSQWLDLINDFNFDMEIRPRDAKRDIVGKLLNYLTEFPSERERLIGRKEKSPIKASSELADALTLLLK